MSQTKSLMGSLSRESLRRGVTRACVHVGDRLIVSKDYRAVEGCGRESTYVEGLKLIQDIDKLRRVAVALGNQAISEAYE